MIYKRGKWYWMDDMLNGARYREPLGTKDWREAQSLEKERIAQLARKAPDPTKISQSYGSMTITAAVAAYGEERRLQVSPRMVEWWKENARPLGAYFKETKLKKITPAMIALYQNSRADAGRAPKTINGEVAVLRQLLKKARLWYRIQEDYKPLLNSKPPVGRALTEEEQVRLFTLAQSRPRWIYAYTAATLSFYVGMRACEIKPLKWKDVDLFNARLEIRRSKTPAGWRTPTLNNACRAALACLYASAKSLSIADPEHFVFPWHGRNRKINPTRHITTWRTAWRSILKAAGLKGVVRFHDGRHTAITTLQEKGVPDWVIQAQVGHVSPEMMKKYSNIRRRALEQAAAALEPAYSIGVQPDPETTVQ